MSSYKYFKFNLIIILFSSISCQQSVLKCSTSRWIGNFPWLANKNHHIYALILARGGSKGVPRKNLKQLNGISLLGRSLTLLHESNLFTEIWVSTEDTEIRKEAEKYGALVHNRPIELAQDTTSSLDAVKEFLEKHNYIEKLALFQCTSVFLRLKYINEGVNNFLNSECVFSVTQSFKLIWRMYDSERNLYEPINFELKMRPRRQDFAAEFYENGMFYFANRELIMQRNAFQSKQCKVVVIPKNDELEIDTPEDLDLANYLINKRKQ